MDIKIKSETWNVSDKRLPAEVDRALDADYRNMVENLRSHKVLINPISVAHLPDETFMLIAGRNRLRASRELSQEIPSLKKISVRIFECATIDEVAALRISENSVRGSNAVGDYMAIRGFLKKMPDYSKAAAALGIPLKEVKDLERNYCCVPEAVLQGVIDGNISSSTAIQVGKISNPQTKQEIVRKFLKAGKLTGKDVSATRKIIRSEALGSVNLMASVEAPSGRNTFGRPEIVAALTIARTGNTEAVVNYLTRLLS